MGPISKALSSGIGLATEAYAARKTSPSRGTSPSGGKVQATSSAPASDPASTLAPPPYDDRRESDSDLSGDEDPGDDDEDDWIRDETQDQLIHDNPGAAQYSGKANDTNDIDAIIENFTRQHPPPSYTAETGLLACPVIIPQRRPQSKQRGFVRAYAPMLNDCGIYQGTFMDFLAGFEKAINKSGYFHAANLAIAASVMAYSVSAVSINPIVHLTAFCVHTSIEGGRRLYMSKQTNNFLETMNEKLFRPHGLYAMIMTYKPSSSQASEMIDVKTHITSSVAARTIGDRSKFHSASGKTIGEQMMPEAAPLVFPDLQAAGDEQKKNAFKKATAFMGDYRDQRAQARFRAQAPDSQLNVKPAPEFASRWADPNHAVNQGGLLGVLSGGMINPKVRRRQRRRGRRTAMGMSTNSNGQQRTGMIGGVKRKLQENVMYLMIVNMPSEAELKEAAALEAKFKEQQSHQGLPGLQR